MLKLDEIKLEEFSSLDFSEIKEVSEKDVAIIGISVNLPNAKDIEEFWINIRNSFDCIGDFPEKRKTDSISCLKSIGIEEKNIKFGKGAYLTEVDKFDYNFFQISPKEASLMHPNQRLFLQNVWQAIEDAGYGGEKIRGTNTGLYLGHNTAPFIDTYYDYSRFIAEHDTSLVSMAIPGNLNSMIASRISYILDLKGPSMLIDTACSSSLVAIHTACQNIRNGECDMAIAGSVKINLFPLENEDYKLGIEASDGRAKTFDESSDGTGRGEGVAAVVLKPLSNALKDGDNIYAVIKGSAVNQDGSSAGITAPNALRQEEVILKAWEDAGINPETIAYIESHGTGTKLGDPIEIAGITRAFNKYTDRKQFCAVGSVKTNIGHLDAGAGIVGLIKAVLALKYKELPPTVHFKYPNKKIDFENSPVYVNNILRKWEYGGYPRRSGVSSFGLSGTNCHVILEEAPKLDDDCKLSGNEKQILTISAKSKESLQELISQYEKFIGEEKVSNFTNICYTANTGREHFNYRVAMIVNNIDDLRDKIQYLKKFGLMNNADKQIYFNSFKVVVDSTDKNSDVYEITEEEIRLLSNTVNQKVQEFSFNNITNEELLESICMSYIKGAKVEWDTWYRDSNIQKVSIPVYQFNGKRCWLEVDENKKNLDSFNGKIENYKTNVKLLGRENGTYNEIEIRIAQIWGEFLGFDEIDVEENFFTLGGDSIIATKIVNVASDIFGDKIEVTSLLRNPTIKRFARSINGDKLMDKSSLATDLTIRPVEQEDYYPASLVQKQVFAQSQFKQMGTALNTPILLMFKGTLDKQRVKEVFTQLIMRHEALRTSFTFSDRDLVQKIHNQVDWNLETVAVSESELDQVINKHIKLFNLNQAPLARVVLFTVSDQRDVLFIDLHHIISDGVSFDILVKDFMYLYEGGKLPDLDIQYKDFTIWQEEFKKTPQMEKQMLYWQGVLKENIPELKLPLDYERSKSRSFEGNTIQFNISSNIVRKLTELAKETNVTLNTLLFGAYTLLLNKYTEQRDIVIGTVVSGRTHVQTDNIIGAFVNLLPIRNVINPNDKIESFIQECNDVLLNAYENQDYHYTSMIEECGIKIDRTRNPIFDTALLFHNEYDSNTKLKVSNVPFSVKALPTNQSQLDIKLDIFISELNELNCMLEYKLDLFKEETINDFIKIFKAILEKLISNSSSEIKDLFVSIDKDEEQSRLKNEEVSKDTIAQSKLDLAISATFTAEPILDYINWWGSEFGMDIDVKFAPYNQVFMELLDPASLISSNTGANLLLVRFEDWIRNETLENDASILANLDKNYTELVSILKDKQKNVPFFVGVFPISTHLNLSQKIAERIKDLNLEWEKEIEAMENVHILDFRKAIDEYDVTEVFDKLKDSEGHIPFTDEYYAALGATVVRKLHSWKNQGFKVVVLDCDNTLWKGVCGEDGALGVEVDEHFKKLQEFMLEKYDEGMLLTLCSKNNESDVWEVFNENPNMVLKKEHFVSHKINWSPKSENIIELAQELNLGLSSFIFIDDNFAECSEVMMNCPEVLTLHLPKDANQMSSYLQHVWAFDRFIVTEEDRKRTSMYVSEQKRKEMQKSAQTLPNFLKGLELKMSMNKVEKSQIARVAQLTKRTNQFNLSTKRMSESDIEGFMQSDDVICWTIEVSDRFGDYGLVGVVITKKEEKRLFIDTFLLSCRVLGRTVEDAILYGLAKYCAENDFEFLEAEFYPTVKNKPFLNFIERSNWEKVETFEDYTIYRIPIKTIQSMDIIDCYYNGTYEKKDTPQIENNKKDLNKTMINDETKSINNSSDRTWSINVTNEENLWHKKYLLPLEKHSAHLFVNIPKKGNVVGNKANREYIAPRNEAEKRIAEIWQQVLGIEKVSVTDNFFELGGTSLDGIQVISKISMEFEAQLNDIFEYDTIESFAKNIPFNKDYLLSLFDKKESIAKSKNEDDFETDAGVQSKLKEYHNKVSEYNDVNLSNIKEYKNILLTGVTGYLGAHMLYDMLKETTSNIHVIVRGKNTQDSQKRLMRKLEFYFNDSFYEQYKERIFIYSGDLSQENFGLSKDSYEELAKIIDCVMNSAANVSHYGKFEESYEINVKGTERLIEFAFNFKQKDLHHISTPLVAFGKIEGIDNFLFTEFDHYVGQEDENIYFRTKLEAERLIVLAREKGLNATIYRVGNLNYNTSTLKFQENIADNAFYSVVKSFIKVNMVPALDAKVIDFSFVNYVSKAIVLLFNRDDLRNETHHVYNYNGISSLELGQFLQSVGYDSINITDVSELFANFENPEMQENIMKIIIHAGLMGNLRDTNFHLVFDKTKLILDRLGFTWPNIEKNHVEQMLEYAKEVQFI